MQVTKILVCNIQIHSKYRKGKVADCLVVPFFSPTFVHIETSTLQLYCFFFVPPLGLSANLGTKWYVETTLQTTSTGTRRTGSIDHSLENHPDFSIASFATRKSLRFFSV